jgi:hypothetical protein
LCGDRRLSHEGPEEKAARVKAQAMPRALGSRDGGAESEAPQRLVGMAWVNVKSLPALVV